MIWDLHCHLSGIPGRTPEERMVTAMRYADRMGIERLCFFMGMRFIANPTPDELRQQNDEVLQAISHWHDRAFGFAYVSGEHVQASLDEINRCVRDGPMVGIKLWVAHRAADDAIDPIIERATELKAVIYQHTWIKATGNLIGESIPSGVVALTERHPNTQIICGHTGGDWELGIRAIRKAPNVFAGIGGFDPTAGMIEMAERELGAERIIFGSDIGGRSFASQLAKVSGAEISQDKKELILGGNLRRLMQPILEEKGVAV